MAFIYYETALYLVKTLAVIQALRRQGVDGHETYITVLDDV